MPDDQTRSKRRSANTKLVSRFAARTELAGLEGAYHKLTLTVGSPMMKRTYLRFFDQLQRHLNVVSVVGRVTKLDLEQLEQIELALCSRMQLIKKDIQSATTRAETLIKKHGLDISRVEFLEPMTIEAKVTSPISRLFIDLLPAGDELIASLDLLVIEAIVMPSAAERQKAELRKKLRDAVGLVRESAIKIRQLAPDQAKVADVDADAPEPSGSNPTAPQAAEVDPAAERIAADARA